MKHRWFLALAAALVLVGFARSAKSDLAAGIAAYESKDYATAYRELLPSAEAGDAEAQWRLGRMFELGLGVSQSLTDAETWYLRAAEQAQPDAAFHLGAMYHRGPLGGGDADAIPWYRIAAEAGHLFAQLALGHIYESEVGFGHPFVHADKAEAQRWFGRAIPSLQVCAAQGDPKCQKELGTLHIEGIGVEQNMREAIRLFRLAAEGNDPAAQRMLGFYYQPRPAIFYQYAGSHHPGLDVLTPNGIESYVWYSLAARQNDAYAIGALPGAEERLTPDELSEARRRVEAWRARQ